MFRFFIAAAAILVALVPASVVAVRVTNFRFTYPVLTGPGWIPYNGPYQFGDPVSRKAFIDHKPYDHIGYPGNPNAEPTIGDPHGEYSWAYGQ